MEAAMRVVLVGPDLEDNLSIRYILGALEAEGHAAHLVRFDADNHLECTAREVMALGAPLVGLSMVFSARARGFARLAERLRELGYRGFLVAGGHFAAVNPEGVLEEVPALDAVGVGEGERILCDLARHLDNPSSVAGLLWRSRDGFLVRNSPCQPLEDLDALAPPRHKEPYDRVLGLPIANLAGSRGCAHACDFCCIAAWHRACGTTRLRLRHPERIAQEIGDLWRRGVRVFNFHDDNFLLPDPVRSLARHRALGKALEDQGVGRISFAIKARADEVDAAQIDLLKSMGLFRVFLGIEGGTQSCMDALGRGTTLAQAEGALALLNDRDLHTTFNLLLLHPDSTLEDFRENVAFLGAHPDHPMNFCRTEVYPGTPMEARLRRQGRLVGDMWGYDYLIADPRAERACRAMYRILGSRIQGADCLNHQAMALDFFGHLAERHHGAPPGLRREVAALIRALNLDTVARLMSLAEVATLEGDRWEAEVCDLEDACATADQVFQRRMTDLQARLGPPRTLPVNRVSRGPGLRIAAGFMLAPFLCATEPIEVGALPTIGAWAVPMPQFGRQEAIHQAWGCSGYWYRTYHLRYGRILGFIAYGDTYMDGSASSAFRSLRDFSLDAWTNFSNTPDLPLIQRKEISGMYSNEVVAMGPPRLTTPRRRR